jgi:uncharacterized protein (UPF0332 family)
MGPCAAHIGVGAAACPDRPDSAASRAYYAAFHGLTAFFALRGQTFTKHTAIRAAIHRDLVQTGIIKPDVARDYDFLLDLREAGDYGGVANVSTNDAGQAAAKAENFLGVLKGLCPELGTDDI